VECSFPTGQKIVYIATTVWQIQFFKELLLLFWWYKPNVLCFYLLKNKTTCFIFKNNLLTIRVLLSDNCFPSFIIEQNFNHSNHSNTKKYLNKNTTDKHFLQFICSFQNQIPTDVELHFNSNYIMNVIEKKNQMKNQINVCKKNQFYGVWKNYKINL
jgi:hypothetical protein